MNDAVSDIATGSAAILLPPLKSLQVLTGKIPNFLLVLKWHLNAIRNLNLEYDGNRFGLLCLFDRNGV